MADAPHRYDLYGDAFERDPHRYRFAPTFRALQALPVAWDPPVAS